MSPHIVFTGGGTAGHVTPNVPLMAMLSDEGWQIDYIGSQNGVEESLIKAMHIPYHAVQCGKLRRYFSWENFLAPIHVVLGIYQASCLLKKLKADIVFSKGGFVAFPVVIAAWLQGIPVVAHESDMSPGLANRLSFPFVNKICLTFLEAKKHFKNQKKIAMTGTPIREELFKGSKERGLALCGFSPDKPCLLVMGGSQGSRVINTIVRQCLPKLCEKYQVIHICGKGKLDSQLLTQPHYFQFEYANEELADIFAASDWVLSRSGANTLCEILALEKPHILVPLSMKMSRGDQIQNANYFKQQGVSYVIDEEQFSANALLGAIKEIDEHQVGLVEKIKSLQFQSGTSAIVNIIKNEIKIPYPLDS